MQDGVRVIWVSAITGEKRTGTAKSGVLPNGMVRVLPDDEKTIHIVDAKLLTVLPLGK